MKKVKISDEKPPQWILDGVKKWGVEWESNIVFTYGNLITSYGGMMTEDLLAHEPHHQKQQADYGVKSWWERYLEDEIFRYEQELECYRRQYQWVQNNIKDRNEVFNCLMDYSRLLSGKMYGDIVSLNEAMNAIVK